MNEEFLKLQKMLLQQTPQKSEAIVWLQGDRYDRGPKVIELYKKKFAPKIVISGNNELIGPEKRPGENNVGLSDMQRWLLKKGVKEKDIIIESNSFNTYDQSVNVCRLAKINKWRKIIVVGSYPHYQARYFLTFIKGAKEVAWTGKIINQFVIILDNKKPGGRSQAAIELLPEEFEKIKKYKKNLVSISQGIKYLNNFV